MSLRSKFWRADAQRGATDPVLVIAAIAVSLVLLAGGSFAVAGLVSNSHDLNARGDLDRLVAAQDTTMGLSDSFANYDSHDQSTYRALEGSIIGFTVSEGGRVASIANGEGWIGMAKSVTGVIFVTSSDDREVVVTENSPFAAGEAVGPPIETIPARFRIPAGIESSVVEDVIWAVRNDAPVGFPTLIPRVTGGDASMGLGAGNSGNSGNLPAWVQPPGPAAPAAPTSNWRDLVTVNNTTTIVSAVEMASVTPGAFCMDITVRTDPGPIFVGTRSNPQWRIKIDGAKGPFFGDVADAYSNKNVVISTVGTQINVQGVGSPSRAFNETTNNGYMPSNVSFTFSVCDQAAAAAPDVSTAYTVVDRPSTAASEWGDGTNCMISEVQGYGHYPYFTGWAHDVDMSHAIATLRASGYTPDRISWSPNDSSGQSVAPATYQAGVTQYRATSGLGSSIIGDEEALFTVCVHGSR